MNGADYLILALVAAAFICAVVYMRKHKGSCGGCTGDCGSCSKRKK